MRLASARCGHGKAPVRLWFVLRHHPPLKNGDLTWAEAIGEVVNRLQGLS